MPAPRIADPSDVISPAMIVFRDAVDANLAHMLQIAGRADRLRPHCKTHKMSAVVKRELALGIVKHKCATFAEAEMLAEAGAQDVVLAYNLVGPNIRRAVAFVQKYPGVRFAATGDHPAPIAALGLALAAAGVSMELLLDIDCGQHRTGIEPGLTARRLYEQIAQTPGLRPGGFHVYDGHQHQKSFDDRRAAVLDKFAQVRALRDELTAAGLPVPRLVCGGTASFPIYAAESDPTIELSPGTCIFNDYGYSDAFPDLVFPPAVMLLTRVISRPTPDRVTCDLGYKAVASDPPAGLRLRFPDLPDAEQVLQNEEHLVLKTDRAGEFQPGDVLYAVPKHVCPTSALHKQVYVVSEGRVVDRWDVTARDRWLTI